MVRLTVAVCATSLAWPLWRRRALRRPATSTSRSISSRTRCGSSPALERSCLVSQSAARSDGESGLQDEVERHSRCASRGARPACRAVHVHRSAGGAAARSRRGGAPDAVRSGAESRRARRSAHARRGAVHHGSRGICRPPPRRRPRPAGASPMRRSIFGSMSNAPTNATPVHARGGRRRRHEPRCSRRAQSA